MKKKLEIVVLKDFKKAERLVKAGYCPVECSFGDKTLLDSLKMDHHGQMAHLESVAVRAYRDFFGVRADDPRFVINHIDADCIFAIASLAGLLPHPSNKDNQTCPEFQQKRWQHNFLPLAETIALMDTTPVGRVLAKMPYGKTLICWKSLFAPTIDDNFGAIGAVYGFRQLTSMPLPVVAPYLKVTVASEKAYKDVAWEDMEQRGQKVGSVLVIKQSRVYGFSEWYQRRADAIDLEKSDSWENPLVIAFSSRKTLIFGAPNKAVAEELLGAGGLLNLFAELNRYYHLPDGEGFGGRESIGGSPRGMEMTEEDMEIAIDLLNKLIQ